MYTHCIDCPEFFEGENRPYYWSTVESHERQWEDEQYRCDTCTKIHQTTKLVSNLERDLSSAKGILDGLIEDRNRKKNK